MIILSSRILFLIVSFFALNCASPQKNADGKNEYFVLSESLNWEYANEEKPDSTAYLVEINKINEDSHGITAEFNEFPFLSLTGGAKKVLFKENGEISLIEGGEEVNFFPAKSNLKAGYNWGAGNWNANIISTTENVNANGKTYESCVHINYSLSITFSAQIWFAPKTGIVKWSFTRTNPPSLKINYFVLKNLYIK